MENGMVCSIINQMNELKNLIEFLFFLLYLYILPIIIIHLSWIWPNSSLEDPAQFVTRGSGPTDREIKKKLVIKMKLEIWQSKTFPKRGDDPWILQDKWNDFRVIEGRDMLHMMDGSRKVVSWDNTEQQKFKHEIRLSFADIRIFYTYKDFYLGFYLNMSYQDNDGPLISMQMMIPPNYDVSNLKKLGFYCAKIQYSESGLELMMIEKQNKKYDPENIAEYEKDLLDLYNVFLDATGLSKIPILKCSDERFGNVRADLKYIASQFRKLRYHNRTTFDIWFTEFRFPLHLLSKKKKREGKNISNTRTTNKIQNLEDIAEYLKNGKKNDIRTLLPEVEDSVLYFMAKTLDEDHNTLYEKLKAIQKWKIQWSLNDATEKLLHKFVSLRATKEEKESKDRLTSKMLAVMSQCTKEQEKKNTVVDFNKIKNSNKKLLLGFMNSILKNMDLYKRGKTLKKWKRKEYLNDEMEKLFMDQYKLQETEQQLEQQIERNQMVIGLIEEAKKK